MHQTNYVEELLRNYRMEACNPTATPMEPHTPLNPKGYPKPQGLPKTQRTTLNAQPPRDRKRMVYEKIKSATALARR